MLTLTWARQTRDVLAEVITKEGLKANCMYCHKAGSQFDARPLCANCLCVVAAALRVVACLELIGCACPQFP